MKPRFLFFSTLRQFLRPTSPVFAFIIPWIIVLIGQKFALCEIIVSYYSDFYTLVIGNMISSVLIFAFIHLFQAKKIDYSLNEITFSKNFKKLLFVGIVVLLGLEMIQVVKSQGFPLLWLIQGNGKTYIDYGITSLNGLLNALFLCSATAFFLVCLHERKISYWICFLSLLFLPVLLVSRQLIICLFLQTSCCLLLYRPKSIKKAAGVLLVVLTAFVILGNYRTGISSLVTILKPAPFIPEFLHSLLWIYAYIVTPFNNMNASIGEIQPLGIPYNEFTMLLPSFLQSFLGIEIDNAGFELVNEQMNVSTFYLPLIQDFGKFYAFSFMMIVQILLSLSYKKLFLNKRPIDAMQYSVLYMIVVLSLFSNLLLYLPVVFQLLMISALKFSITRKKGLIALKKSRLV